MKELSIEEMTTLKGGIDVNVAAVTAFNNQAEATNINQANGGGVLSPAVAASTQVAVANAGNIDSRIKQFA